MKNEELTPTEVENHQEALEQAALSSLGVYSILTNPDYQISWHHQKIIDALEAVERGEITRLILEMPPRHGKTQLATINFPTWCLGRHPNWPIIVSSYNTDLALDFGTKSRDLMQDEVYQRIFKDISLKKDDKSKAKWRTNQGGAYISVGVGGAVTGRGAKILIIDDPLKNWKEAMSSLTRQQQWEWFTSTAYTRLEKNGCIILILTRWHMDDIAGRIEEAMEAGGEKWTIVRFPAIAEEDEEFRKAGEALWPEKYDLPALENIRNTVGVLEWASLYQQTPLLQENQEFNLETFKYFEEKDITDRPDFEVDITIDPAISEKKTACDSVIEAVGKFKTLPDWYVLDYIAEKMDPMALINKTFQMYADMKKLYPRAKVNVWVESIAYQKSLIYYFREEMKRRDYYFTINEFKDVKTDKESRIRGLIPLYQAGVIWHRKWMKKLETQLLQFPKGKLIDIVDCLSFNLNIKRNTAKTLKFQQAPYQPRSEFEGGDIPFNAVHSDQNPNNKYLNEIKIIYPS